MRQPPFSGPPSWKTPAVNIYVKVPEGAEVFRDFDNGRYGAREIQTIHRFEVEGDVLRVTCVEGCPLTDEWSDPIPVAYYKRTAWRTVRAANPDE